MAGEDSELTKANLVAAREPHQYSRYANEIDHFTNKPVDV